MGVSGGGCHAQAEGAGMRYERRSAWRRCASRRAGMPPGNTYEQEFRQNTMGSQVRNLLNETSHRPLVMGVLNVTPDSFSDGGDYFDSARAVSRAMEMIEEGADIIDVGPESTRPGSLQVPATEQIKRAIPVIRTVRKINKEIPISIDTRLASVAVAALESGADMINDTSALRDDPELVDVVADSDCRPGVDAPSRFTGGDAERWGSKL